MYLHYMLLFFIFELLHFLHYYYCSVKRTSSLWFTQSQWADKVALWAKCLQHRCEDLAHIPLNHKAPGGVPAWTVFGVMMWQDERQKKTEESQEPGQKSISCV